MNPPRTLIIGLDGATFGLINPLVRAGCLPTLERLMAQGAHGPLLSWPAMNSAVTKRGKGFTLTQLRVRKEAHRR